jgi:hypothetical protein
MKITKQNNTRIFSTLGYTSVGKIYIDGTKLKGNASAKRTKDRAGFEKWLSELSLARSGKSPCGISDDVYWMEFKKDVENGNKACNRVG